MCSKKAAQGLSEEKAFVCLALAAHKASERILFKDLQSFSLSFSFLNIEYKVQEKKKWYWIKKMDD